MTADGQDTVIHAVLEFKMKQAIDAIFRQITRILFPTGFWLDKTPNSAMVRGASNDAGELAYRKVYLYEATRG